MRLYFSQITMAVISRMFRLIGIDIIYVPFYSSDLKKLKQFIDEDKSDGNTK